MAKPKKEFPLGVSFVDSVFTLEEVREEARTHFPKVPLRKLALSTGRYGFQLIYPADLKRRGLM